MGAGGTVSHFNRGVMLIYLENGAVAIVYEGQIIEYFPTFSGYVSYVNKHVHLLEEHFSFIEKVMAYKEKKLSPSIVEFINGIK